MKYKKIVVLGSTGSIGIQTLDVIRSHRDTMQCIGLCAGSNVELLNRQIMEFCPKHVGLAEAGHAREVIVGKGVSLILGQSAATELAQLADADIIVNAVCGFAGTLPLVAALHAGKTVALANKESIVCANPLIQNALKSGGRIIPVDSEQSAIFQCLMAGRRSDLKKLILTASGGPFRTSTLEEMEHAGPEQALNHPIWNMGKKISLDSATMFNKGLEIMEAAFLFDMEGGAIEVLLHPQSIVHSMVEFIDGSIIAQLGTADMRTAIQYSLTYPERIKSEVKPLSLFDERPLTFERPDVARFPAIKLAYAALNGGNALPIVYNAANEAAASMFLAGKTGFLDIARRVEYAMERAQALDFANADNYEAIVEIDRQARRLAQEKV